MFTCLGRKCLGLRFVVVVVIGQIGAIILALGRRMRALRLGERNGVGLGLTGRLFLVWHGGWIDTGLCQLPAWSLAAIR